MPGSVVCGAGSCLRVSSIQGNPLFLRRAPTWLALCALVAALACAPTGSSSSGDTTPRDTTGEEPDGPGDRDDPRPDDPGHDPDDPDDDGDDGDGGRDEDTTPPVIADLAVVVSMHGATIGWETDEPASARIDYGETPAYGAFVQDLDLATTHAFELTGLAPGTTYHYNVVVADAGLHLAETGDATFVTAADTVPPEIANVELVTDGETRVLVTWTTDEPALSRVDWGTTPSYGSFVQDLSRLRTSHSLQLDGLLADTTYHFAVSSADASGNVATTEDDVFFNEGAPGAGVSGTRIAWQPLTLSFEGPEASELDDAPNPFLFYRLAVELQAPSGATYRVFGFFDGDGLGGSSGNVWRARFAPGEAGTWSYVARFDAGEDVGIETDLGRGTPLAFEGLSGTFAIQPRDREAPGFHKWGLLEHVGEHYLKFRDGPWFLKGGADSPENLLGYAGFDDTVDQGGASTSGLADGLHRYGPHVEDWEEGDPLFASAGTGYDSRGIVGALNYLAAKHVNGVYFLVMNLGGDGQETYPFVGPAPTAFDKTHYDISKLRQWDRVFEHAQRKGILLHVVLGETEPANEDYLDSGGLGRQRKLFYKEMVARFAHHLAIKWNLGEETNHHTSSLLQFAEFLRELDPYDHPIAFHTHALAAHGFYGPYQTVLGQSAFSMTSIQASPDHMGHHTELWRGQSAAAGHKWVVDMDEQTDPLTDENAENLRRRSLYDVFFSGGNLEWYFGYFEPPLGGDLRTEDFRTRDVMWDQTWYARDFLESGFPFQEMEPMDHLLSGESSGWGGGEVFAKHDAAYAVYFPETLSTGTLDLTGTSGTFTKRWYDPRTGTYTGSVEFVRGGGPVEVGPPPGGGSRDDWVVGFVK